MPFLWDTATERQKRDLIIHRKWMYTLFLNVIRRSKRNPLGTDWKKSEDCCFADERGKIVMLFGFCDIKTKLFRLLLILFWSVSHQLLEDRKCAKMKQWNIAKQHWISYEKSNSCNKQTEVEFVHAVTAGGSVKFLPAV